MNEKRKDNKKNKLSGSSLWWVVIAVVIGVINGLSDSELSPGAFVAVFLIVGGGLILAGVLLRLARAGAFRQEGAAPAPRREAEPQRAAPREPGRQAAQRRQPSVAVHRAFPEPEAHCVVCENTGEDHFSRDRTLRLRQLEDWLKNGLIDRAEYRVLRARYEKE